MERGSREPGGRLDRESPQALPGYEHVNRYWDPVNGAHAAKILPGEYYVTLSAELITTVLGSCVSACIRDRRLGIGGMNHFMLPHTEHFDVLAGGSTAARYGSFAMEVLINDILKNGGHRRNLEIKLFGGASVLAGMTDVGRRNIAFAREYLDLEGLRVTSEDLGGFQPRKVIYFPGSGRVRIKKLKSVHNDTIFQREVSYMEALEKNPVAGGVELF